jgi:hypothetical protein
MSLRNTTTFAAAAQQSSSAVRHSPCPGWCRRWRCGGAAAGAVHRTAAGTPRQTAGSPRAAPWCCRPTPADIQETPFHLGSTQLGAGGLRLLHRRVRHSVPAHVGQLSPVRRRPHQKQKGEAGLQAAPAVAHHAARTMESRWLLPSGAGSPLPARLRCAQPRPSAYRPATNQQASKIIVQIGRYHRRIEP